ncbi:MAG: sigma-70 family RNA polymerase sigma factor [Ignavibacteriales bacterium]|nr:sigma-70 family RNA polymerase sigma factor [Ignavibacteriales bacterium]
MLLAVVAQQIEQNQQDADLVKRIQQQDKKALSQLYDLYSPILYPLALRIVSSQEEAEDVLQEVFLQIWSKVSTYTLDRGSVYSWLVATSRNKAIGRLRSINYNRTVKEVEETHSGSHEEADSNSHPVLALKGYTETIREALRGLSKLEVKILELSYYKGYSQSEIARVLKMPLGTVKMKMRKGIQRLRQVAQRRVGAA